MKFFSALFALSLLIAPTMQAENEKPNFLVIMVDDLGYGDLSCYGAPDLKSPNIDGLFASGMRFDSFYANCPVCSPTRASLITGLYPDNAGVPGVIRTPLPDRATSWGNLRNDVTTLPSHLKTAGYDTAIVGKWHLGLEAPDRPNDVGFDFFHGFLGDMMDDYYTHLRHDQHYMRKNEEKVDPEGHATDIFTDWATDYIKSRKDEESPFFLYLAYNAPHTPIQPPEDWLEKVIAREKGIDKKRAALVALIEHLDHGVGRVLSCLEEEGLRENTVVLFTSDNGGQVSVGARNAPLHGGKQDMWEGGIRVGTCVSWPGKIEAGSVQEDHISLTMDIYPTLAEIAGAPVKHEMDGRSFLPVLLGQPFEEESRPLFWVRLEGNARYGGLPYHAARVGDWKLLRNTPFEPYQMFNMAEDPAEENPIQRGKAPRRYDELFQSLLNHINEAGKYPWQRENP
ncbi:MAG: N-acetylgalactosamine 6-sulfate sulfatase [Verrucomicrobiales bacterium]|nr:N-acetylgalactosamine 6-sulfate sulfatase [Verrucomicrobiales bacterium]